MTSPHRHRITVESGITWIRFRGAPEYEDFRFATDELASAHPQKRRLWDLRDVAYRLTLEQLVRISDYGKALLTEPCRVAVLVSGDFQYGVGQQFEAVRTVPAHTEVQIFRDEEEAVAWLQAYD